MRCVYSRQLRYTGDTLRGAAENIVLLTLFFCLQRNCLAATGTAMPLIDFRLTSAEMNYLAPNMAIALLCQPLMQSIYSSAIFGQFQREHKSWSLPGGLNTHAGWSRGLAHYWPPQQSHTSALVCWKLPLRTL